MNFTAQPNLSRIAEDQTEGMREGLPRLPALVRTPSPRVAIKVKGKILFVDLGEVVAVQAEGNYVLLHRNASSYMLRESISALEKKLEPYGFIRIHRSILVNAAFVEEIRPYSTGEYGLRVRGGKEYTVTRTYKKNLKSLAEFWIGTSTFFPN
jgi:two-component system LytT family response regulator